MRRKRLHVCSIPGTRYLGIITLGISNNGEGVVIHVSHMVYLRYGSVPQLVIGAAH